jgi:LuxR family maltose regulon positive regulatory protein
VSVLSGYRDAEIYHAVIRSRLSQIEGDVDAAAAEIEKAVGLMQAKGAAAVREEVIAQQVRVYLGQRRLAAAERALAEIEVDGEITSATSLTYPLGLLHNSKLRILLYRAEATGEAAALSAAVEEAGVLIDGALQRQYVPIALKALLLRAQMHAMLGDEGAGRADYAQALALGQGEGFISIFVEEGTAVAAALASLRQEKLPAGIDPDYVAKALSAFPAGGNASDAQPTASPPPAAREERLIEPLSERELEVLRLIREGLSNREIAQQLAITLHTVKKHNSNIYGKLGVTSRTQAVARARRLGLL